ncbi:MAG: hypothetical protein GX455_17310 [Phycisphaerae bacterium]|nr:hypothetical protein [Phycisphaerae bacterium]
MIGYMMAIVLAYCFLLFVLSLCAGTAVSFRLYHRISLGDRIIRSFLLGFGFFIFLLVSLGALMAREADRSHDYWRHRGYYFWPILSYSNYRIPLEYPYEIYWGKGWDGANIQSSDKQVGQRYCGLIYVISIHKQGSVVLGEYSSSSQTTKPETWFIFNCKNGQSALFDDKEKFLKAAEEFGAPTDMKFVPVKQAWKQFWAKGSNWKQKPRVRVDREF